MKIRTVILIDATKTYSVSDLNNISEEEVLEALKASMDVTIDRLKMMFGEGDDNTKVEIQNHYEIVE